MFFVLIAIENYIFSKEVKNRSVALMVELADTWDLKSQARNERPGSNPGESIFASLVELADTVASKAIA